MVSKAREIGISVLVITNHNNVDDIDLFRDAAGEHDVAIFPGFEISSSEGIHVLCIYPGKTPRVKLSRFLGEFGIRETGQSPKNRLVLHLRLCPPVVPGAANGLNRHLGSVESILEVVRHFSELFVQPL